MPSASKDHAIAQLHISHILGWMGKREKGWGEGSVLTHKSEEEKKKKKTSQVFNLEIDVTVQRQRENVF